MSRINCLTSPPTAELLQATEEELTRCLRLLVGCLSKVNLFDHLPKDAPRGLAGPTDHPSPGPLRLATRNPADSVHPFLPG